jgi:poly-gamma-glutamate capsule biosynthesis protein CapA/YwtB (metallophosphatase superfamily)
VNRVTLLVTGDLILDEPDPDSYFDLARPTLHSADLVVGHVEVPFTLEREGTINVPLEARDPAKLSTLAHANVRVASLAANHLFDEGTAGVQDTLNGLRQQNIVPFGAGLNLDEARAPAFLECGGFRLGFLSYNCVGPSASWAGSNKAGGAYVHVLTHYELDHATPGGAPTTYTGAEADSLEAMKADIARTRSECDFLGVSLHKGTVHTPALIMPYEKQIARSAVDAGADLVASHHAHILRGIEVYKGKPIYHGLGNFVTVTHALSPQGATDANDWALRRMKLFGFVPDPETPEYPFHPESRHSLLAKCVVAPSGEIEARFLPVEINRRSQPEILGHDTRGQTVVDYVERITREAGLNTGFAWDGDEVVIRPGKVA